MTPNLQTNAYNISGYSLIRNDRKLLNKSNGYIRGGGIAIYIHNNYNYRIIKQSKSTNIKSVEYLITEISHHSTNTSKLLLCLIYRRPNGDPLDNFFDILDEFSGSYDLIIISGDLNSNLMSDNIQASNLRRLTNERKLCILDTGTSYHLDNYHSWLDVIITNNKSNVHNLSSNQFLHLNHFLITATFNLPKKVDHRISYKIRDWSNCNFDQFNAKLYNSLLPILNSNAEVNDLVNQFYNTVLFTLDSEAPLVVKYQKRKSKPWITKELSTQMRKRDKIYHNYRKNLIPEFLTRYKAKKNR